MCVEGGVWGGLCYIAACLRVASEFLCMCNYPLVGAIWASRLARFFGAQIHVHASQLASHMHGTGLMARCEMSRMLE